ncbi:skin secretory protein xP2-like [Suricata suricatta]|uniref:skin secretory protein xP2-like n=1 Tax=Suricata suricatta TaxID=37032 RepID=UPI0011554075|nr:skin secretory protein xP2-like [Suricata suricatta]
MRKAKRQKAAAPPGIAGAAQGGEPPGARKMLAEPRCGDGGGRVGATSAAPQLHSHRLRGGAPPDPGSRASVEKPARARGGSAPCPCPRSRSPLGLPARAQPHARGGQTCQPPGTARPGPPDLAQSPAAIRRPGRPRMEGAGPTPARLSALTLSSGLHRENDPTAPGWDYRNSLAWDSNP